MSGVQSAGTVVQFAGEVRVERLALVIMFKVTGGKELPERTKQRKYEPDGGTADSEE